MKSIFALLFGLGSCWNVEYTVEDLKEMDTLETFHSWASDFNRKYSGLVEESERYLTWLDNLYIISAYNSQDLSFKLRLNQFGDMTKDEFRHYVHGDNGACFKNSNPDYIVNSFGRDRFLNKVIDRVSSNPDTVDWTTKGVVTPVKNQGQCGSCWSFSATGAMECQYAIKTGTLNSLSEQELVDCAGIRYGCEGCNGGEMAGAMKYAAAEGGLCSEEEYPYTAKTGTCEKSSRCTKTYDANKGVEAVTPKSSEALETATAAGCVSIGIEADQTAFQHYSSGVLTGKCGTAVDHGVLVVGYGTEEGQKYWKVKNSWGTSWGEDGYVKICRDCNANDGDGECGILTQPNVPTY